MERLRSHLLRTGTLAGKLFDIDGLLNDQLLQACFQETLRLRAQPGPTRIVYEATTVPVRGREYHIRKDSTVFIPTYLIHHDPEIYGTDVNEFHPERFIGAELESTFIDEAGIPNGLEDVVRKGKSPIFFKRGVPVRHYMMPFGGGESLVHFSTSSKSTEC